MTEETSSAIEIGERDAGTAPLISSMHVEDLFGRYTYTIAAGSESAPPVMLIYGDNGSGKTTILTLLWNLLSPARDRGHRTRLAQTAFREFSVSLSNGDVIRSVKRDGLVGSFDIAVTNSNNEICRQDYSADSRGAVSRNSRQLTFSEETDLVHEPSDRYIKYLNKIKIDPYFLADNRQIYSDRFGEIRDVRDEYRLFMAWKARLPNDRSALAEELSEALRRTNRWIQEQAISGAAEGSESADGIYLAVLSQLVGMHSDPEKTSNESSTLDEVRKRILDLEFRSRQFSEYGLVPLVKADPFIRLINQAPRAQAQLVAEVLTPYLDGQHTRLDFLQSIESTIRTFIETVNSFFVNKKLTYSLSSGLQIWTTDNGSSILEADQLSSGERQLLLLFCNALLSRNESALFIIDEPEISLNVKWQRNLIPALVSCIQGSNVQFILATHSIEIITGRREFLAQLNNLKQHN